MTEVKEMKKLPEGWKRARLGEVIIENPKSPFKVEDADNSGKYPFFTSGDKILTHSRYIVEGKNIFIGDGGESAIYYHYGNAAYSNHVYSIKPNKEVNINFLYAYLSKYKNKISYLFFTGTGLKNLNKPLFKREFFISLPPLPEQQKIAKILSKIDEVIEKEEKYKEKLKKIKQGLMEDLLTGKVRVNHLIEEGVENVQ